MNIYSNYLNTTELLIKYDQLYDYLIRNIDFDYIEWIFQLIKPFMLFSLILFLLPITLVLITYALSLFVFILKHKNKLQITFNNSNDGKLGCFYNNSYTLEMEYKLEFCDYLVEFLNLNNSCSTMSNSTIFSRINIKQIIELCYKIEEHLIYFYWLLGFFSPLLKFILILYLLPCILIIFLYASSLFLFIKKHWSRLKAAYSEDIWKGSFKSIAVFWETQGAIWHGHEIVGFENIPESGPGLLIYYHAAFPIDFYYVNAKTILYKNRRFRIVADRFLFKVPGLKSLLDAFEVTPGTVESCMNSLNDGHLLAISPGGVREALFSDHNYDIIWAKRCGFAKAAIAAKAPVIPMFTKNCREAIRSLSLFRRFFRWLYEKTRLPLVPIYGLFPVKLVTYIGKPIEYDENRTVEELVEMTKQAIEDMIKKHQRVPGSIFHAQLERFIKPKND